MLLLTTNSLFFQEYSKANTWRTMCIRKCITGIQLSYLPLLCLLYLFSFFMYMSVLAACMYVQHVCAWCP